MKQESKKVSPFFKKFLEHQVTEKEARGGATMKYPSDNDEYMTRKWPSDKDEIQDF